MLSKIGNLIEKRPGLVIGFILLITVGFSILLPSLEMKTDYRDFMPDDDVVEANFKVVDTFGQSQMMMFLYVNTQNSDSVISANAIREQQYLEKKILNLEEINESISVITILDQICLLEYGETLENCTDEQINVVIQDILNNNVAKSIQILDNNDEDEIVDFNRFPRISKGRSIDEIDIKNCFVTYDDDSITYSLEVYELSSLESNLKSPIPFSNVMEWYIDFENIIQPDPRLDIDYKIAAHLEPKHSLWELGKGPIKNLKEILDHIRNRELVNSFKKEAYLWIRLPDQSMYLPIPLNKAHIEFDTERNLIKIKASRDELANYGIAIRYGLFELPAKLSNFKAGTRYYQSPIGRLPWIRISANTSYILNTIEKIMNRPILGNIAGRLMKNFANLSWEDYDSLFGNMDENIPISDQLALKEIEDLWINADYAPDVGKSENVLFIRTHLFDELRVNLLGFLSKDYEKIKKPSASIMILTLNVSSDYDDQISKTKFLINEIKKFDKKFEFVKLDITGDTVVSVQMNELTNEANMIIMPLAFIAIILVLFFSFRRVSYILLPLLALVVSAVWLFGTMVLLGIPFTMMSIALIPLIMGLGVDYSVHLSHNYRIELSNGKTPGEAIKISVSEVGTAMFLAMLTTVIAFLSFLSASMPPLRDLGILLALGIVYTFITAITLQAAVRYLIDHKKEKTNKKIKESFQLNLAMGVLAKAILNHQKKILAVLLLVTIISAIGAIQIKTGFNFESFMPEDSEGIKVLEKMQDNFPYASQDQEYIFIEGRVADVDTLKGIKKTFENLDDDTYIGRNIDGSIKAVSIYSIVEQAVSNNLSLIEKFNLDKNTKIPNTDEDVEKLYDFLWDSEEYGIQTKYCLHKSEKGKYDATVLRIYTVVATAGIEGSDLEQVLKIMVDEFEDDLAKDYGNVDVIVTGNLVITHVITASLSESQITSTIISLFLATLVLILVYKKLTLGLIAIIPVLTSIVWILGTMSFINYSLNVITITVTSLTIGIGIDYAIHTTERFKIIADKTGDINVALTETISKTGGALLIAALTTTLGFGMLVLAPIPPQVQFGVIMVMTITYSFITSVLLLPLILCRWAKWQKKRKGFIISPGKPKK